MNEPSEQQEELEPDPDADLDVPEPDEGVGKTTRQRTGERATQFTDTEFGGASQANEPDTVAEPFGPGRGPLSEEEQSMRVEEET